MNPPTSTKEPAGDPKKGEFPWIVFGVPIGCAIGVAIRNLALGIGIGMVLGGTVTLFRAKKDAKRYSIGVLILLIVACVAMIGLGIFVKK